ncbi:MAG: hypothetical protein IPI49_14375 [Myxococcales bacterium]|nr:hypothetical protein [Myxococcales bacterium]
MSSVASATALRPSDPLGRRFLASLTALALVTGCSEGCGERGDQRQSRFSSASRDGAARPGGARDGAWAAACGAALRSLGELAPQDRPARLLRECAACDLGRLAAARFDGSHAASWLAELDDAIESCGGYCTPAARKDFLQRARHQLDLGEHSARPWRSLGQACPVALGVRPDTRAYLGATWFALHRVAQDMARSSPSATDPERWAHATFPLPALAPEGQGLQLPTISADVDRTPRAPRLALPSRLAVTVLADRELVTRLPWARMADGGIDVDGAYPGAPASDLAAAVAHASLAEPVTLLAPSALLASRLLDVLTRMDRPARLAVEGPTLVADYAPPWCCRWCCSLARPRGPR